MAHPQTLRYKRALNGLQATTAATIGHAFANLPSHDQQRSNDFIGAIVPVVGAAQQQASALTAAYLGQYLPTITDAPVDPAVPADQVVGAVTRNGAEPGDVYRRSFVGLWAAVAAGTAVEVALAAARSRIEQAVSTDIHLAARATSRLVLSGGHVTRYQRVSSGGCDLCADAGGKIYSTDDLMPIHPSCKCVGEPLAGNPPLSSAADEVIALKQHDELGPLLWAKGDTFNS